MTGLTIGLNDCLANMFMCLNVAYSRHVVIRRGMNSRHSWNNNLNIVESLRKELFETH